MGVEGLKSRFGIRSLRLRLQLWYGAVLVVAVGSLAAALYLSTRFTTYRQIDEQLDGAARFLDALMRGEPRGRRPRPGRPDEFPLEGRPPEEVRPEGPPPRPLDRLFPPPERDPSRGRPLAEMLANLRPDQLWGPAPPQVYENAYIGIWRENGDLIYSTPQDPPLEMPEQVAEPGFRLRPESYPGNRRELRIRSPNGNIYLIGRDITWEQGTLAASAYQLILFSSLTIVVGLVGGWWISSRLLAPLRSIAETAQQISARNLQQRIDAASLDIELAELATILNSTFERLEHSFERQARFTADASHELRTPLAILQTHLDLALSRARSMEEYQETLASCAKVSQRLRGLIESLMTLARADAGTLELELSPIDLTEILQESISTIESEAKEKGVEIQFQTPDGGVYVRGDGAVFSRVPDNLLSNALRYSEPGGTIEVTVRQEGKEAVLIVADRGAGIPEEDLPRIFERFYRADKARSRKSGGIGLGLSICQSVVEAHRGKIELQSQLGKGTTVIVRMPALS